MSSGNYSDHWSIAARKRTGYCDMVSQELPFLGRLRVNSINNGSFDSQQAAQGAGRIMDLCSRGDGKVKGQVDMEFLGTPLYIVDIRTP